jgi:hypothetical protein
MSFAPSDNRFTGYPVASKPTDHAPLYNHLAASMPSVGVSRRPACGPATTPVWRSLLASASPLPSFIVPPSSASAAVATSTAEVGLLRLNRRGEIVAAHSAAAAAPTLADAHADADWALIIAALDEMSAQAPAPLPSSSATTPPTHELARKKGELYLDDIRSDAIDANDANDDDDDADDDDSHAVTPRNGTHAATERRGGGRKRKHGRVTRLIDVLKDDPKKAMRQALREAIIALTLAAGVLVAASIVTYVFAGSAVAMFVVTAGAVVLATLGAIFMVRLNVAQAYASSHPVGERQRRQQRRRAAAERRLCRAAALRHMRCRQASREQNEQALARLRKVEPEVYRKLMAGQEL